MSCLLTNMKAKVNDANLAKFGDLLLDVTPLDSPSSTAPFSFSIKGLVTLTIIGDGYFADSTLAKLTSAPSGTTMSADAKSITLTDTAEHTLYFANGTFQICINSKYDITYLRLPGAAYSSRWAIRNVEDVKFMRNLTYLGILYQNKEGNAEELFQYLTKLTTLNISSNKYSGILNELASKMIANGRGTGTMAVYGSSNTNFKVRDSQGVLSNLNASTAYNITFGKEGDDMYYTIARASTIIFDSRTDS